MIPRRTFLALTAVSAAFAQDDTDRITVPFSDPSGAKRISCSLIHGSITVKVHSGKDAIVEAKARGVRSRREPPPGMRRIGNTATGPTVEESGNSIRVVASHSRTADVTLHVPADTSVKLNTVNSGHILVEGLSGEIDANNINGNITVNNVSGAVVAHTLNGKLIVSLQQITPNKAMSFSTLNGNVDVTLPATTQANLKMKSENGEIFSDFEIALKPTSQPAQESKSQDGKRYRVRFDKAMYGSINGGGPEMQFTTLNGTIYIRKK
ncbi:MAG: DUF4097 family beta strand repeat protein [Bryobacterales bacterium]|nr:DUF4097 family beta strand repeat protein [Bryobacterales bacterium]